MATFMDLIVKVLAISRVWRTTLFHVSHVSRCLSIGTGYNQSLRFLGVDAQRNSDLAGGIAIGKKCYRAHRKLAVIQSRGIPV